ncbi:MAG TPA: hypothetical protein VKQ30_03820 [Ktedonobacterales bacterium]|nr:hypothetical protein [Ktedonobacterales bacterium]
MPAGRPHAEPDHWLLFGRVTLGLCLGSVGGVGLGAGLFVVGVLVLRGIGGIAEPISSLLPWADPVYTRAALHSLADVQLAGMSFGGPGPGGPVTISLEPGGSVLGRLVSAGLAASGVLCVGLLLLRIGVLRRSATLIGASVAVQFQVVLGLLASPPRMEDLETVGVSFAVNAVVPWLGGRRLVLSDVVAGLPPSVLTAALVAIALGSAYVLAASVAAGVLAIKRWTQPVEGGANRPALGVSRRPALIASLATTGSLVALSAIAAACKVATVAAPAIDLAPQSQILDAVTAAGASAPPISAEAAEPLPTLSLSNGGLTAGDRWFAEPSPSSRVEIVATDGSFTYVVNGKAQVIHGMGINTQYTSLLSATDRRARLDADLEEMHALGVNTLVGWDPAEFDAVLLEAAQRQGIGVVMPFDLHPDADYTDPTVRATLTQQVLAWVDTYRRYPAVRMWGLGNEVLHKIVHPSWVGPQDPQQAAEARAFSDWLVETADAIHTADPDHPVTYREAEDAFVGWVARALQRHPAQRDTWFVWGTNCYQDYLSRIVDNWPDQGTGVALWVSEFAPGGLAIPDRPVGFTELWGYVRKHPDWVLGGAVYAWTRNGPEEIDRNLGLTDDGTPVDGRSLDAIGAFFNADPAR